MRRHNPFSCFLRAPQVTPFGFHTISFRQVGGSVQVCPAHVVPVPLGAHPPLGQPRIRRLPAGRAVGAADGSVLVHQAAQGPARARVLGCWPGDSGETSVLMATRHSWGQLQPGLWGHLSDLPRTPRLQQEAPVPCSPEEPPHLQTFSPCLHVAEEVIRPWYSF